MLYAPSHFPSIDKSLASALRKVGFTACQSERLAARRQQREDWAPEWVKVEGARWYVARVFSGHEARVCTDLRASGWRAYSPTRREVFAMARIAKGSNTRRKSVRLRALCPGYVFVGSEGVAPGKSVHDKIVSVISSQGEPLAIPGAEVAKINLREMRGEWDAFKTPASPVVEGEPVKWALKGARAEFSPGDEVLVSHGPFAGMPAVVAAILANMRVSAEVNLMGRSARVSFDACQIEKTILSDSPTRVVP